MIGMIYAVSPEGVIGRDGTIPWRHPGDWKRFRRVTLGCTVVMGRATFESIGTALPGRRNLVVTSRPLDAPDVERVSDVKQALERACGGNVWFIGGARVYEEALRYVDLVDVTYVPDHVATDGAVMAPTIDEGVFDPGPIVPHEDDPSLRRRVYTRRAPAAVIRPATERDVSRLVEMNHAAYPELVEANVVWSAEQLRMHLARFPEGQLVAELGGVPMGAISTFIVPRGRDPMAQHTWLDITNNGTFASHDPEGETLYLADVYVDPAAWGKRVSQALYEALWELCRSLGLRRVVAGGRLWGYVEHADRMTPEQYVAAVVRGELRDRVLGSQIKAGFVVRGILKGYLKDPRSLDFATLLEWNAGK